MPQLAYTTSDIHQQSLQTQKKKILLARRIEPSTEQIYKHNEIYGILRDFRESRTFFGASFMGFKFRLNYWF